MAAAPEWKVIDPAGEYVASCKEIEGAAVLADFYGNGSKIKHQHRLTVWTEGAESQPAAESWDYVAHTAYQRVLAQERAAKAKHERAMGHIDWSVAPNPKSGKPS